MRAVRIVDGTPTLETLAGPEGDGVCVKVASSSICGSDLHLLDGGIAEGMILGHEFCGIAPDGTPVAVEPMAGCGSCWACDEGHLSFCSNARSSTASACRAVWPTKSSCTPMRSSRCRRGLRSNTPVWSNRLRSRPRAGPRPSHRDRPGAGHRCRSHRFGSRRNAPPPGDPRHGQRPSPPPAGRCGTTGRLPRCRRRLRRRDRRRRHQCLNR